jgi:hypothetical protein
MFMVLVEAPRTEDWLELRSAVVEHLAAAPHLGASVVSLCTQIAQWGEVQYADSRSGPSHAPHFTSSAMLYIADRLIETQPVPGPTGKTARQRACVVALALACGFNPPTWRAPAEPIARRPEIPEPGANPIAALQEYAQAIGAPLPTYSDERVGGTDNAPLFTVACAFQDGQSTSPTSSSKKAGKKAAARLMLERLRSRSDDEG